MKSANAILARMVDAERIASTDTDACERALVRVHAALAAGATPVVDIASPSTPRGLGWWLAVLAVVAAGVAIWQWPTGSHDAGLPLGIGTDERAKVPPATAAPVIVDDSAVPAPPPADRTLERPSTAPEPTIETPKAPRPVVPPKVKRPELAKPAPDAAPTAEPPREVEIIRRANAALRRDDARAARAALALHHEHYPRGVLVQERSALEAIVHCQAGDGDAARAFLSAHPASPHIDRIKAACGLDHR